jgi:23S rRNA pseudouridine2604 synthase
LLRKETAVGALDASALARVIAAPTTLSVAGRLDRSSRGLLVLTQDGTIARRLIGGNEVEKEYLVKTTVAVTDSQLAKLRGPLRLDDQPLRPMQVDRPETNVLRFVLIEGRNHQIRRVCRHVGLHVLDLFRVAIGPFSVDGLPEGHWRVAKADELQRLMCQDPPDA